MLLKSAGVWFLFVVLAIVNGGIREKLLIPHLGSQVAQVLSVLLLSALIILATIALFPLTGIKTLSNAWQVGALWVVMTVAFEFLFGHYVVGDSWADLLDAYKFWRGKLWIVVILATFCAPYLAGKVRSEF